MRPLVRQNLEQRVAAAVNDERRRARLGPLAVEPELSDAARVHSEDMLARNYFSHVSPEQRTVADRVADTGYRFVMVGENIAWGQRTAREVMNAWMRSPGHRANILSRSWTRLGVGVADRRGVLVWTQTFAVPAGDAP